MKIAHHTKNQNSHNLNEKRQLADAKNEIPEVLKLPDKDCTAVIIKMFQLAVRNILKRNAKK